MNLRPLRPERSALAKLSYAPAYADSPTALGARFALGNERRFGSVPPAPRRSRGRWVILMPDRQRCKPSSVPPTRRASGFGGEGHLSGPAFADELSRLTSGSGLPAAIWSEPVRRRCLALHPVGFTLPTTSLPPRCALTAPFHPYRRRFALMGARVSGLIGRAGASCGVGGIFSVALSLPVVDCPQPTSGGGRYPPPWLSGARTFLCPPQERTATFHATSRFTVYQTVSQRASRDARYRVTHSDPNIWHERISVMPGNCKTPRAARCLRLGQA